MAFDTINSIGGYITRVRGTDTQFVRNAVINGVSGDLDKDYVDFEAAKTAGASVAGTQVADIGGIAAIGSELIGAADGTYTATVTIDNVANAVSVDVLLASTDWDALVIAINADLPATECALAAGNLLFTSTTTGNASYVSITDGTLFAALPDFVAINAAVDGGTGEALKSETLDNGANAWNAYGSAVESYDTGAAATVIASDYAVGDLNVTFSDTEVEAELTAIKVKLDALQDLVEDLLN